MFLIFGVAGIAFFFWKYDDVFPAASIDLKLSKPEIAKRAAEFAKSMGYPTTKDTVTTTTFYEESATSTFLEYEYDMRAANALMKSEIPCWLWYTRLCRPSELEEYKIWLTPDGTLDSVSHEIEKERALPSLTHEKALALALDFMKEKAGISLADSIPADLKQVDSKTEAGGTSALPGKVEAGRLPAVPVKEDSKAEASGAPALPEPVDPNLSDAKKADTKATPALSGDSQQGDERPSERNFEKPVPQFDGPDKPFAADVFNNVFPDLQGTGEATITPTSIKLNDGIKIVRDGSIKQAARTDHYFTFEDEKKDFKGGKKRYSVYISGNRVSEFNREFHVPEAFERKYREIRSYNELFKTVSSVLFAIVSAGTMFAFIWALSSKRLRWRLVFIAALAAFVLEFLDYWNYLPSILQGYDTAKSLQGFLSQQIIGSILSCCQSAFFAAVVIGGIEAVYRTRFPKMVAVEMLFTWRGLSSRTMLEALLAGIFVFGIHLGYVAAYYLVGTACGMWSPLEVREVSTLSSVSPAFSSFGVGVNASISEELLYRVFCFVLAQIVFKNFWIANFVQAVGWAFMHSDYPQEPAYARGLELTIVGLFYGWIFRRFGVITGIVSHFVYDAFLGVTSLILSGSPFLIATSLLACSPPFIALAMGLWRRKRHGEPASDDDLLNENYISSLPPESVPAEELHLEPQPLGKRWRSAMLVLILVGVAASTFIRPDLIGGWAKVSVSKRQVEEIALRFLKERGIEEGDWKIASSLDRNLDETEIQYGTEKIGYDKTREMMKSVREPVLWWVRLFKPKQTREYGVVITGNGRPIALNIQEEEDSPGDDPGKEKARELSEQFLKTYRPELQNLEFDSITEQKRPARTDYVISYEIPRLKMGDARFTVNVSTVGKQVSFPRMRWDVPESWRFERNKQTFKDYVCWGALGLMALVLSGLGIFWIVGLFRTQAIHWRPAFFVGLGVAILVASQEFNEYPGKLSGYDTDVPFASFLTTFAVKILISAIMYGAGYAMAFAIGHAAFRLLFPGVSLLSLYHSVFRPSKELVGQTRVLWFDGALAAYLGLACAAASYQINLWLEAKYSPDVLTAPLSFVSDLASSFSPSLVKTIDALMIGFVFMVLAPVVRGIYLKYIRSFKMYCLVSIPFVLIMVSTVKYWQTYLLEAGYYIAFMIGAFLWFKYCARNNPIAYFLMGALFILASSMAGIYACARDVYSFDLWFLMSLFFMPLLVPVLIGRLGYRKMPEKIKNVEESLDA